MDVYLCDECGLELKKKPEFCVLCGCKEFRQFTKPDPDPEDQKEIDLLESVIDDLGTYTKDCDPGDAGLTYGEDHQH
jgi:hypothetical protein